MEGHHYLLRPLLPTAAVNISSTTNALADVKHADEHVDNIKLNSSNNKIILRLFSLAFVGILSTWANHEASKGFEISIENHIPVDSAAGRRFQLMYVGNDKATRLLLNTSKFVETILYPDSISPPNKKQVNRVTLRLSDQNLTHRVTVDSFKYHDFVLNLSPSDLGETNYDFTMLRAVQQGMARVWIFEDYAPNALVNGMVEYISRLAGMGAVSDFSGGDDSTENNYNSCWMDEDPVAVARFLSYCEEKRRGCIQRLNQAMKGHWQDRTVDDAIGMPAQHLCASYMSRKHLSFS